MRTITSRIEQDCRKDTHYLDPSIRRSSDTAHTRMGGIYPDAKNYYNTSPLRKGKKCRCMARRITNETPIHNLSN